MSTRQPQVQLCFENNAKLKKECTHIYTLRDRYLSNLCTTCSRLCNVRVNCFACGLYSFSESPNSTGAYTTAQSCSQDARNASPNLAHLPSPTATALVKATINSYPSIHNSILMVSLPLSICAPSYKPYESHLDVS